MIIDNVRNGQCGNQQAVLDLIDKFTPLLKKYARELKTEDAYYDLQAEFLELILCIDCNKLRETSDGAMVQYLSQSIYHAYIKLRRHLIDNKVPTISADELTDSILYQNSIIYENHCNLFDIPHTLLTPQEANIFYQICILGHSSAELARKNKISRQAVNQTKQRAISKLRRFFKKCGIV